MSNKGNYITFVTAGRSIACSGDLKLKDMGINVLCVCDLLKQSFINSITLPHLSQSFSASENILANNGLLYGSREE